MIKCFHLLGIAPIILIATVGVVFAGPETVTTAPDGATTHKEASLYRISFDAPSLAPMAFLRFCIRYPRDCEIRSMHPDPITLTLTRITDLIAVNRTVNEAILPRADNSRVNQEEWLLSPRAGDCNDYAVTKRHMLLSRGWPSRSLLLAEVVTVSGQHHLVLVVRTREDDLLLDNLDPNIHPVSQGQYKWVRAQYEKNPKLWSAVSVW